MKSYPRRIGQPLLISLVLHLSIAILLMFVTFNKVYNEREMSFLNVTFINLESPKTPIPRVAPLKSSERPMSLPNQQLAPTAELPKSRHSITGVSRDSSGLVANVTPTVRGVRLSGTKLPVSNQRVTHDKTSSSTSLSIGSSEFKANSEQLKSELSLGKTSGEVIQAQRTNPGRQRGIIPKNVQVMDTSTKMSGIDSLVSRSQVADADDVLEDITDKVVLGGEIPPLPKGEPGGIIVGRRNDIKGRLNLVRLNDPLHPSLYG